MRACSVIKAVFFCINNYIVLASSSRTKTADALSSRSFTFIFFLFFFFTSSSSHTEAALLLTLFVPLQLTRHDGLSVFVVVNKVVFSSSFSRGVSPRLYGGWRMPTHATRRHHRTPAGKKTQSSIPLRSSSRVAIGWRGVVHVDNEGPCYLAGPYHDIRGRHHHVVSHPGRFIWPILGR